MIADVRNWSLRRFLVPGPHGLHRPPDCLGQQGGLSDMFDARTAPEVAALVFVVHDHLLPDRLPRAAAAEPGVRASAIWLDSQISQLSVVTEAVQGKRARCSCDRGIGKLNSGLQHLGGGRHGGRNVPVVLRGRIAGLIEAPP